MSYNNHYYELATPPHSATPPMAPPSCYYGYYEPYSMETAQTMDTSEMAYESLPAFPSSSTSTRLDSRRKCGSNKKERRRTQSINNAFASLRECIPNVPCDTKLSKIKTLRLATSYIDYLMGLLNDENPANSEGFKADVNKKWNEKSEEQKRRELEAELNNNGGNLRVHRSKGGARTGWPQTVWALELKH